MKHSYNSKGHLVGVSADFPGLVPTLVGIGLVPILLELVYGVVMVQRDGSRTHL